MSSTGAQPVVRSLSLKERVDSYERLVRLDKPIGILLLLWPTLTALWFASHGAPTYRLLLVYTLGTVTMRCAGCAFNDWADRRFDAHVERTAGRPLARGEIAPWEALVVGAGFALGSFAMTLLATNRLTVLLAFVALAITIAYPFFKRFFALPQAFLGIAFSFGIPMAFAGALGFVSAFGWWLFAFNLFWVVAYDTEYAMVDRDDDLKLGLRTSAITFGRFDVIAVAVCYVIYFAGMAWLGGRIPMGEAYWTGLGCAVALALYHLWLIRTRDRARCFRAFLNNHWLGLAVFAGVVADYAWRQGAWPRAL
ncbi:MAG TPA: 4-hydroxybenzoate octaprenyltransferase [Casimicrobiaceae bacterium]|nr:4-hydroxybenzoate octaprenyltransferase [Casimicrobiaceae bacterium]